MGWPGPSASARIRMSTWPAATARSAATWASSPDIRGVSPPGTDGGEPACRLPGWDRTTMVPMPNPGRSPGRRAGPSIDCRCSPSTHAGEVVNLCRLCLRLGTSDDGPGAPCRPCIHRAVGIVVRAEPARTRHHRLPHVASSGARGPLTVTERTAVAVALRHLTGRSSDVALACALPFLALEVAVRAFAHRDPKTPESAPFR
jgi:hypothetical protein